MAEEFIVEAKLDQPAVLAGKSTDVYSLITIKPNPQRLGGLLESTEATSLPAHLIVIVDVSGSMQMLIEHDPEARTLGQQMVDGRLLTEVETTKPSRLKVAINVVQRLHEQMTSGDRMTLIAFDQSAYPLAKGLSKGRDLEQAILQLADTGGGATSLGEAFKSLNRSMGGTASSNETRRVILLTDGEDNYPDEALHEARQIATEHRLPIFALGTGDSRADFLMEICRTTLGGAFDNISSEREAEACFHKFFTSQKNILATNVKLQLWLSPEMFVRELYRTKPEVLFVGDMQPDANNVVPIAIEYMERGRAYEFLFRCTVPARDGGRFRLARTTLTYDVPALSVTGGRVETNVVVEHTADPEQALVRVGDVRRVISQAETQRQLLFLQEKRDLIDKGQATEKDKQIVSRLLATLVKKFEEVADQANANLYRSVRDEYERSGIISQETMNRSLAASSKVEGAVAIQEVDDF